MIKFLLRLWILITLISYSKNSNGQKNTDGEFLFKTWFFLEHVNSSSENLELSVKDSSIFSLFHNDINLRIDTLNSSGFPNNYIFLSVNSNRKDRGGDSSLTYNKNSKFLQYIAVPAFCDRYILCVNKNSGLSYRIQGFAGNDFLILLNDLKVEFYLKNKTKLTTKNFLKTHLVKNVDFKCLYDGLLANKTVSNKYPCLINCRGSMEIIWVQ